MKIKKDIDVIMLALPRWDGSYFSTSLSLAEELSKRHRVFYVDNPFTIKDVLAGISSTTIRKRLLALTLGRRIYQKIRSNNSNLINVTPRLVLPINFLPHGYLYTIFSSINNAIVKRSIQAILKDYSVKNYIFINSFNPFFLNNIKTLKPALTIYQTVDSISESRYIAKHGIKLEREMITQFDITLTTSVKLWEYASRISAQSYFLPNAANFDLFNQATVLGLDRPVELEKITTKIVGYIGHLDHRIDYSLLRTLISTLTDYTFVLVGPMNSDFIRSGIKDYTNVVVTGSRALVELPRYLQFMDCTIIPFLCNELTSNIYPLKLNEYLAAGKPVVTTKFSTDLKDFAEVITMVETAPEFVTAVVELINQNREDQALIQARINKASRNTWSQRVEDFSKIIGEYNTDLVED